MTSAPLKRLSPDPDGQWARAVGRFMLAFGDIEHTTIACLCGIPSDSIGRVSAKIGLGLRLDLLQAVLEGKTQPEYESLASVTDRISKFLNNRNLVAHNPVQFSFYRNSDDGGILIQPELVSTRDRSKRLTFEQLEELAAKAEELAYAFSDAAMEVFRVYHMSEEVESLIADGAALAPVPKSRG